MITLSPWQFYVLLLLAAYALARLLILPLLQRIIYRRSRSTERALDEELEFGLPAYAMANRQLWIDRILSDPQVIHAIEKAAEHLGSKELAMSEAKRFATEIVPTFNAMLYFRIGNWIARKWLRAFYWLEVGFSAQREYRKIRRDATVVIVSNHRSNFDPLFLIYLTSKNAPVSYSAGEWARVTPFRQFIHALGFIIVRRDQSDNALYHKILERYVFQATSHCIPQGLFIEGSLSRDGRMQPLKLGMLNYLVKAIDEASCKDIVFIPCALNYDKIPEDKTLIIHQEDGFRRKGKSYALLAFLKFFVGVATYVVPRQHKPFGYACVNFGKPLSLHAWQHQYGVDIKTQADAERRQSITRLGNDLAQRIGALLPVLPTYLLASVLGGNNGEPISELKLKIRATELITDMTARGVPVFLPNNDEDYALSQGIYVLLRRKIIEPTGDGRFRLVESRRGLLEYYCNTISEFVQPLTGNEDTPCN